MKRAGEFSQVYVHRTQCGAPAAPQIAGFSDHTTCSVHIRWTPPIKCNGAAVRCYELQWRFYGAASWQSASAKLEGVECKKNNLLPNRKYEFRVRAQNRVGWGPFSAARQVVTQAMPTPNISRTQSNGGPSMQRVPQTARSPQEKSWRRPAASRPRSAPNSASKAREKADVPSEFPTSRGRRAAWTNDRSEGKAGGASERVKEWFEMADASGNVYYWSEQTGSIWEPPRWIDQYDESGYTWYENTETGETTWTRPDDYVAIVRDYSGAAGDPSSPSQPPSTERGKSPLDQALYSPGEKKIMSDIFPTPAKAK